MKKSRAIFIDFSIFIFFFIMISILAVWTTNYNYILKHILGLILAIFLYYLFSKINFQYLLKFTFPLHIVSVILLSMVLIPGMGITVNGAKRWLDLGIINFQPSELAKLTLILYLTSVFYSSIKRKNSRRNIYNSRKAFFVSFITAFLILIIQRDFSTAAFIFSFYLVVYFIANENAVKLLWGGASMVILVIFFILNSNSYRFQRIKSWIDYLAGNTEPVLQLKYSLLSLSLGGKFGVGYGGGEYKEYLPASHTDFIFSVMGEELGFVFLLFIMSLYVLLMYKIIRIIKKSSYDYELYFLFLGGYLITAQAAINMGVTVGLFPITGLTLPFISYGRTSFLIFMALMGLMRSVEKEIVRRSF
ncbi:MAG: hypothetical protein FXF47_07845 [Candidatus Mcinerneyibacterium aminivorans]|uniref:Probable peptidoglycan glycosyltransferase FtsW n=1 Tax=Candidatus Mcinerneyibacterium aminivorans TaxID=2703815 RepID=A0A5D0MGR4_9BACT|nr:MAG: hypothetical protein FXF47_07845 [Candidatus Mcinerneyibacterium aminivorans]